VGRIQINQVQLAFGETDVIPPLDLLIEDGEFVGCDPMTVGTAGDIAGTIGDTHYLTPRAG